MLIFSVGDGEPRDESPCTGTVYACRLQHCAHSGAAECQAGVLRHQRSGIIAR